MTVPSPSAGFALIGGSGSSGTTLLASVLDGLHDLRTSAETWLFHQPAIHHSPERLRDLLQHGGEDVTLHVGKLAVPVMPGGCFAQRDLLGVTDADILAATDLPGFVALVKQRMAERWGGSPDFLWVDQTPKNAFAAVDYLQSQPDGRFIHLLRDGRDVICSLVRRWQREAPGHPVQHYLVGAAKNWTWDVSRARRARALPGYLELRYEEFVRQPVPWTNRVLHHLGRPPVSPQAFEANRTRPRSERMAWGDKASWGATPDQPIDARSVGRWRNTLLPGLVAQLRQVRVKVPEVGEVSFGAALDSCGYRD